MFKIIYVLFMIGLPEGIAFLEELLGKMHREKQKDGGTAYYVLLEWSNLQLHLTNSAAGYITSYHSGQLGESELDCQADNYSMTSTAYLLLSLLSLIPKFSLLHYFCSADERCLHESHCQPCFRYCFSSETSL